VAFKRFCVDCTSPTLPVLKVGRGDARAGRVLFGSRCRSQGLPDPTQALADTDACCAPHFRTIRKRSVSSHDARRPPAHLKIFPGFVLLSRPG